MSSISDLHGPVGIPMTNDYLFHALLQENNFVLKSLICDLLHLDINHVSNVTLNNPIQYGRHFEDKTFILDVRATLDDGTEINLEMQVLNKEDWTDRSLSYLCRSFDSLNTGDKYSSAKPVCQISFLDYTLFPDTPQFYSQYCLREKTNHKVFSSKFQMIVVDLTHIELATEDDIAHRIDQWARFFKAKSWEEIAMLSQKNPAINEAASTVRQLTADEEFKIACEARERYNREQDYLRQKFEELKQYNDLKAEMVKAKNSLAELQANLSETAAALSEKDAALSEKDAALSEKDAALSEKDAALSEKDAALSEKDAALSEKDAALSEKDAQIAAKDAEIAALKAMLNLS